VSPWKVILATMVIFVCGVVTGALVIRTALPRPGPLRGPGFRDNNSSPAQFQNLNLLRRMDKELALTTNQHVQIEKIIHASQDRTQLLWNVIAPQMKGEVARMRGEVHDALNQTQQKQFEAMLQSRPRGSPLREGEPRHGGWTNDGEPGKPRGHGRTNGQSTNNLPTSAPQLDGTATNGP
jgi:hypothetical protein